MASYHEITRKGKVREISRSKAQRRPFLPEKVELSLRRIAGQVQDGLTGLALHLALEALGDMREAELCEKVGPKGRHRSGRSWYRYGRENGWVVLMGRKVAIQRPRARSSDRQEELVLQRYLWAQQEDSLAGSVLARLLQGVSTRGYAATLEGAEELPGHGTSKSRISARFIEAMGKALEERLTQRLDAWTAVALLIDGVRVGEHTVVAALGIDSEGHKRIFGLREGATENEAVVRALLEDLVERGLRYEQGLLVVTDGSKALRAAIRAVLGKRAAVQRCQVHKLRNVLDHLPRSAQEWVARKMRQAYREPDYEVAKRALERLAGQLEAEHPGAADSLREGLEETLTVHRLGIPGLLRTTLSSTNPLESVFSTVAWKANRVRRWRTGEQATRWVGMGLMAAEKSFRRLRGYQQIPLLQQALRQEARTDLEPKQLAACVNMAA